MRVKSAEVMLSVVMSKDMSIFRIKPQGSTLHVKKCKSVFILTSMVICVRVHTAPYV